MLHKVLLAGLLLLSSLSAQARTALRGRVVDSRTQKPIAFATIYLKESGKGTVADVNGVFRIAGPIAPGTHLMVSSLGYQTKTIVPDAAADYLLIALEEQSVALQEFAVTARYADKTGSKATIGQEALEYIGPTSLNDIFILLPGGRMGSNNMQDGRFISSRQVGADRSTSFGMGIIINGVPMNNDGMRTQLSGLTGFSAADREANVTVNSGLDLRTLSTDHIERVVVNRGVSSAKEGNLSAGTIEVRPKQGQSPWHARVKFDPLNKLAYVGKGFRLSDNLGTLHAGIDVVRSQAAIEDARGAYNRVSAQLNWNNQRHLGRKTIDWNILGSGVTSFSNRKSDEMISAYHEQYKSEYQRMTLSLKCKLRLDEPWMDDIEWLASADYTRNRLRHHKHVINRTVMPLQQNREEGEAEGIFLPSAYDTYYEIDNRPLNIFTQINARKFGAPGPHTNYSLLAGASLNRNKNMGDGAVADPMRPPFPSADYIRPRKNSDVPALANQAAYLEGKWRYRHRCHEANLSAGIRENMMLNLPADYFLHGRMLWEPRLQAAYTFCHHIGKTTITHTLRAGYGEENKLPSADFLYPDKTYHDFIALNAYFSDERKRLLITNTKIQNPVNKNIKTNRNKKWEMGYDLKATGYELSLTAFAELMRGGIEYLTSYTPTSYTYYYKLKHPVQTKPQREDFLSREVKTFVPLLSPTNSAKISKRGVEYRIHIPEIAALHSEVEINGAYYKTVYTNGVPVMYRPAIMVDDNMYPYVGIYDGFESAHGENLNTNLWVNTHLPKWKLIFTNFIQVEWFEKTRLSTNVSEYPEHYMDTDGNIRDFNIADDEQLARLRRNFLSARYNEKKIPFSLLWNIKATKEFSRNIKLSFFANNVICISPKYKDQYAKTARNRQKPFFGGELMVMF